MAGKRAAPKRHFVEFSKLAVTATFLLVVGFILYVCVEMHIQQNLEPVSYVGAGLLVCLGVIVRAYMKRAYQKDLVNLEIEKAKKLTQLKEKHGDDFVYEPISDVSVDT